MQLKTLKNVIIGSAGISLVLFCFCKCSTGQNTADTEFKPLQPEYLSADKLSEWKFLQQRENTDLYVFTFLSDSLPYFAASDSLFKINTGSEMYILYYNCSVAKNTGYIIYGNYKNQEVHIITTGIILSCKAYKTNQKLLLEIVENLHWFPFDYPPVLSTDYLLFSLTTHSLLNDFSVLSKAAYIQGVPETSELELQVGLSGNNISVNGNMDDQQISCIIKIEGDDFVLSKEEENLQWSGTGIFEKKKIYSRSLTY